MPSIYLFLATFSMSNSSVFQSIHSSASHHQAPFNCHSSCSLMNSTSRQKTKQLLGFSAVSQPSNKARWVNGSHDSSTGKHEHACHLSTGFTCPAHSSHSAAWLTFAVKEQRNCQFWHTGCKQVVVVVKCFLQFLVAQFLCSSVFIQCWRLDGFFFEERKHRWEVEYPHRTLVLLSSPTTAIYSRISCIEVYSLTNHTYC